MVARAFWLSGENCMPASPCAIQCVNSPAYMAAASEMQFAPTSKPQQVSFAQANLDLECDSHLTERDFSHDVQVAIDANRKV